MPSIGTSPDLSLGKDNVIPFSPKSDGARSMRRARVGEPRRHREPRSVAGEHTIHINIGRVEVPRMLPPVREIGTQTEESSMPDIIKERAKWYNRAGRFAKKWIWPVVAFVWSVTIFLIGRVGIGVRLN